MDKNMDNKIFSLILKIAIYFFALSNIAFALAKGEMASSLITQNGFYVGGDMGAADFMDKESHSVNPESHQLGAVGAVGGGVIGYDYGINNNYRVAIEGFIDANNLNANIKHAPSTYKMSQQYNIGVRLLPEYVFTPYTVGHFIVGYANGRFTINDNGVYGFINTSYNQSGFQTGAGLTTVLIKNIFVRLDALYTSFPSSTKQGVGLSTPTQNYTNRFSQLAGEFAVIYKFD